MSEWWRGAVIYQIYPRSFQDTNADGIGDLPGILQRLPYIASLGVDAIWICPFFRSPMDDFGYDIEDYRDVDPMFGTLDDADRLIQEAHRLGLKVVMDMALSHTSIRHRWFQDSRRSQENSFADWYVWADPRPDGTQPNNWLSMFGGPAWTWESRRQQYYFHNFFPTQPDLNLHNPEVQDALLDECRFWLDRGIDGFRLDACNFLTHDRQLRSNPPRPDGAPPTEGVQPANPYNRQLHLYDKTQPETLEFLKRLRALGDSYGDVLLLAEIADDDSLKVMQDYAGPGAPLHTAYCFAFLGPQLETELIARAFDAFHNGRRHGWPSWAFSNHDVQRVVSRWGGRDAPPEFAKLLIALLGSLRGTIFLYQGEELGLPEADVPYEQIKDPYGLNFFPDFPGRDGCRTPMPWDDNDRHAGFSSVDGWLPVPNEHLMRSVGAQNVEPGSVLNFTRDFLAWRKTQPALVRGDIHFVATGEPGLVAFVRAEGEERLLAVFNTEDRMRWMRLPRPVRQVLDVPRLAIGRLAGDHVELPGHGGFFALLEPAPHLEPAD
ncbi:alpha-glucosidase [Oceanibaculum pacificum]|uniref:Alpha-glucosidase n=1 Tax=Oceanibaculum pacificum TaxID=580166 RepID=A0A154WGL9_9PROT|nr:alpha-glucosidase [Oceanibaculum pacificum]